MWCFLWSLSALAAPPTVVDELMAQPSPEARLTSAREISRAPSQLLAAQGGAAVAVLTRLTSAGRTDPSTVRAFLDAAFSVDPVIRSEAISAAASGAAAPVPAVDPPVAVPSAVSVVPVADAGALVTVPLSAVGDYADRQLVRDAPRSALQREPPWVVRYGDGTALNTSELLLALGDLDLQRAYRRQQNVDLGVGAGLGLAGGLAIGAGLYLLPDATVDPHVVPVTALLLAGGVALDAGAFADLIHRSRRAEDPSVFFSEHQVDVRIDTYNQDLATELSAAPP